MRIKALVHNIFDYRQSDDFQNINVCFRGFQEVKVINILKSRPECFCIF